MVVALSSTIFILLQRRSTKNAQFLQFLQFYPKKHVTLYCSTLLQTIACFLTHGQFVKRMSLSGCKEANRYCNKGCVVQLRKGQLSAFLQTSLDCLQILYGSLRNGTSPLAWRLATRHSRRPPVQALVTTVWQLTCRVLCNLLVVLWVVWEGVAGNV